MNTVVTPPLQELRRAALRYRSDILVGSTLFIVFSLGAYLAMNLIGDRILVMEPYGDTWFDSDIAAYYGTLADPDNAELHYRGYKHPLLSLLFCLPVYGLQALQLDVLTAVRVMVAGIAGLWGSSLFGCLRLIGGRLPETSLLTLLGGVSAAGLFWLPILESYPLGSLGLIWALALVALLGIRRVPKWLGIGVSIITVGVTVTNWAFGCVAVGLTYARKQALRVHAWSFALVIVLLGIQKLLFRSSLPLNVPKNELRYVNLSDVGGSFRVIQAAICHTLVMPSIQVAERYSAGAPVMTIQLSAPGSASVLGAIAVGLWLGLLALGFWRLFTMKTHTRVRLMLGLSLLGHLILHLIYTGRETFLYSLHFLPFLLGIAALGSLGRTRLLFLGVLAVLLVCVGMNNLAQFQQAAAFYHSAYPPALGNL